MRKAFLLALLCLSGGVPDAAAEPYLAVREGLKCMACHVNPTGGGMRSEFGSLYGQAQLPATPADPDELARWAEFTRGPIGIGADLRSNVSYVDLPGSEGQSAFSNELRAYLSASVLPDRLLLYVDQRLTPAAVNQEAYVRLWNGDWYVKAGRMYLPYGLRLQDDSAFIRRVPGINFASPDDGVEFGLEREAWSMQFAASNGAGGGPEQDDGKQASLRLEYVQSGWRAGASANFNDSSTGQRRMGNLFAGLRTGAVAWLGEADYVVDDGFATGERRLLAGLLEADWHVVHGHNLKLTAEYFDPDLDVDEDQQTRHSLLWEYTPIPFLQLRLGSRWSEGIPQNPLQNQRQALIELHGFF
ncbi:MAG: hypothetical protein ACREE7_09530 [Dongiaceae bacterium]